MKWISVKDEFPISRFVIVSDKIDVYFAQYSNDEFRIIESNNSYMTERGITHWMPLPKPPKE